MDQIQNLPLGEAYVLVDQRDLVGQTALSKRIRERRTHSATANHDNFPPIRR